MCVCFKRLRALNLLDPAAGAGAYRSASRRLTAAREWKRVYVYIEKSSLSLFFAQAAFKMSSNSRILFCYYCVTSIRGGRNGMENFVS